MRIMWYSLCFKIVHIKGRRDTCVHLTDQDNVMGVVLAVLWISTVNPWFGRSCFDYSDTISFP